MACSCEWPYICVLRGQWGFCLLQVASKLLHKDLDDDQLDAMMEFADTMSHSEAESSSPDTRLVDAEAFCRLVARFASPE